MQKLHIIIVSTRPGRVGPTVAAWFRELAERHGGFELELVDLKEVALPLFDEPHHPRLGQYVHPHTVAWSAKVAAADAFVLVSPEYNWATPPSLVNALDYLSKEWAYKAVGLVTYGGVSGGLRAAQMTRQIVGALKMVPIVEAVALPFVGKLVKDGKLESNEAIDKSALTMLDELLRWTHALKVLR